MKKLLLSVIAALMMASSPSLATAKEKLYIVNSGSTNGTFNAILSAYASDLKTMYDVEYVQAKGCSKASVILKKIKKAKAKAFYISQGIKAATSDKCSASAFQPTQDKIIASDIKFGMIFGKEGHTASTLSNGNIKIGYNTNVNKKWLSSLDQSLKVTNTHVRYKNSTGVVLAVLNGEVDLGFVNSTKKVWKQKGKLVGLLSLNPKGDNGVPPLNTLVNFNGSEKGQVDNFFVQGLNDTELVKFRKIIADLHRSNSTVGAWYKKAVGYTNTATWARQDAVHAATNYVNIWRD
jgi:hypothetical protein